VLAVRGRRAIGIPSRAVSCSCARDWCGATAKSLCVNRRSRNAAQATLGASADRAVAACRGRRTVDFPSVNFGDASPLQRTRFWCLLSFSSFKTSITLPVTCYRTPAAEHHLLEEYSAQTRLPSRLLPLLTDGSIYGGILRCRALALPGAARHREEGGVCPRCQSTTGWLRLCFLPATAIVGAARAYAITTARAIFGSRTIYRWLWLA